MSRLYTYFGAMFFIRENPSKFEARDSVFTNNVALNGSNVTARSLAYASTAHCSSRESRCSIARLDIARALFLNFDEYLVALERSQPADPILYRDSERQTRGAEGEGGGNSVANASKNTHIYLPQLVEEQTSGLTALLKWRWSIHRMRQSRTSCRVVANDLRRLGESEPNFSNSLSTDSIALAFNCDFSISTF